MPALQNCLTYLHNCKHCHDLLNKFAIVKVTMVKNIFNTIQNSSNPFHIPIFKIYCRDNNQQVGGKITVDKYEKSENSTGKCKLSRTFTRCKILKNLLFFVAYSLSHLISLAYKCVQEEIFWTQKEITYYRGLSFCHIVVKHNITRTIYNRFSQWLQLYCDYIECIFQVATAASLARWSISLYVDWAGY